MPKPTILSIEAWAKKNKVKERTAYRWAKLGKLPTIKRTVEIHGVLSTITKKHVVNAR